VYSHLCTGPEEKTTDRRKDYSNGEEQGKDGLWRQDRSVGEGILSASCNQQHFYPAPAMSQISHDYVKF